MDAFLLQRNCIHNKIAPFCYVIRLRNRSDGMIQPVYDRLILLEAGRGKTIMTPVMKEFEKRKKKQLIVLLTCIPVVLLYLLQSSSKRLPFIDDGGMAIASLLFLVGVIVFTLLNWRCPNCNSFLGKRFLMKKCDQCGVRLQGGQGDAKRKLWWRSSHRFNCALRSTFFIPETDTETAGYYSDSVWFIRTQYRLFELSMVYMDEALFCQPLLPKNGARLICPNREFDRNQLCRDAPLRQKLENEAFFRYDTMLIGNWLECTEAAIGSRTWLRKSSKTSMRRFELKIGYVWTRTAKCASCIYKGQKLL